MVLVIVLFMYVFKFVHLVCCHCFTHGDGRPICQGVCVCVCVCVWFIQQPWFSVFSQWDSVAVVHHLLLQACYAWLCVLLCSTKVLAAENPLLTVMRKSRGKSIYTHSLLLQSRRESIIRKLGILVECKTGRSVVITVTSWLVFFEFWINIK